MPVRSIGRCCGEYLAQGTYGMVKADIRSRIGDGRLRSYLLPVSGQRLTSNLTSRGHGPPGAVGGTYGSGCFQLSSNFSVSESRAFRRQIS